MRVYFKMQLAILYKPNYFYKNRKGKRKLLLKNEKISG